MDRPEWIAVDPHASGSVYCTLTNNSDRGKEGKAPVDAANPRANNVFGHIMHWHEEGADPAAARFKWDILVMAGRTDSDDPKAKGSMQGQNSAARMACRSITGRAVDPDRCLFQHH